MSRIKNILVPVDFSNASKRALRYACELADTFEATLHVLHVVEHPYLPGGYMELYPPPAQFFDQVEQESREQLETLLTPEERARYRCRARISDRRGGTGNPGLRAQRREHRADRDGDPWARRCREADDGQCRRANRARCGHARC